MLVTYLIQIYIFLEALIDIKLFVLGILIVICTMRVLIELINNHTKISISVLLQISA